MIDLKVSPNAKLLWVDLEMTGLDPAKDRILEAAAIVTDFNFNEIASFSSAVYQPPNVLKNMNDWCKENHAKSGLLERVKEAPKEKDIEQAVAQIAKEQIGDSVVLAGNSIYMDRLFIKKWWPKVEELLHYRMLDVSSFKILMRSKYGVEYTKKEAHRALDDIKESIAELKFYLKYFDKKKK